MTTEKQIIKPRIFSTGDEKNPEFTPRQNELLTDFFNELIHRPDYDVTNWTEQPVKTAYKHVKFGTDTSATYYDVHITLLSFIEKHQMHGSTKEATTTTPMIRRVIKKFQGKEVSRTFNLLASIQDIPTPKLPSSKERDERREELRKEAAIKRKTLQLINATNRRRDIVERRMYAHGVPYMKTLSTPELEDLADNLDKEAKLIKKFVN
jgi:hypothetical protein